MIMPRQTIPAPVKQWADAVIQQFNDTVIKDPNRSYSARYRASYLYLDRLDHELRHPIARLTYTGSTDDWEFAIYKYSDERYDAEEWLFPGSERVDGTLEGAMRAGLEAYS
jgi:hypothetical protein